MSYVIVGLNWGDGTVIRIAKKALYKIPPDFTSGGFSMILFRNTLFNNIWF
jgi:hypothetical protein